MKKGEEYAIQEACVTWFRLQYPEYLMYSVPMEATWRNKYYFEGLGSMAGVSDTIVMLPGHILFVEFKSRKGRQSPDQKIFQEKVELLGFEYFIIKSVEDFQRLVENKLNEI